MLCGAAVSDLERRDRDVDGERIGKERSSSHSELRKSSMTVGLGLVEP